MFYGCRVRAYRESDREDAITLFERGNIAFHAQGTTSDFSDYMRRARGSEIDRLGTCFQERGGQFWMVGTASETIGMLGLQPAGPRRMELRRLYVDPASQTAGLGRHLLAFAERAALRMGATELCLSTSAYQTRAIRLYQRNGYDLRPDHMPQTPTRGLSTGQARLCGSKSLSPEMIPALADLATKGISHV